MLKIKNVDEIIRYNSEIRNAGRDFVSNFFCSKEKISLWIKKRDCFIEKQGNTLFIIKKSVNFWKVFFSSLSLDDLCGDISVFKSIHNNIYMSIDVVGLDSQCHPILEVLIKAGFNIVASLVRMSKKTEIYTYKTDNTIRFANREDNILISNLLHVYFNEKTEQLPYDDELNCYIALGRVLVCVNNDNVVGFLIFEMSPSTLYLRYLFTLPEFRDRKVASRLLRKFFEVGKMTKRQILWVVEANDNAVKRYRHYGFNEENMHDFVLTNCT